MCACGVSACLHIPACGNASGHTVWHAGLQSSPPVHPHAPPCVLQKRLKPLVREVLKRVADSSMVRRTWPAC